MEQSEICVPFLLWSTNKLLPFERLPHSFFLRQQGGLALYFLEFCSSQRNGLDLIHLLFFISKWCFLFRIHFLALVLGDQLSLIITSAFWGIYNCQVFLMVQPLYNVLLKRIFWCHIRIRLVVQKMLEISCVTLFATMLWFVCRWIHFVTKYSYLLITNLGEE